MHTTVTAAKVTAAATRLVRRRPAPRVVPLTRSIGAVVEGLDRGAAVDASELETLRAAVALHHVVFLPGRQLGDHSLRRLAARFGTLRVSPVHELVGATRTTSVIEDSEARPPAGFDWHTDLSWTHDPPELGFLSALTIPPVGGDTLWVSLTAAYAQMPAPLQERCRNLRAIHRPDSTLLASVVAHHGAAVAEELQRRHPPVAHPLVRLHPVTGRPGLFVSPLYVEEIAGLDREGSDRLLVELRRAIDDPHHQVRWRWSAGDLAIWDETATCHRALADHYPQLRRMRRCVVGAAAP